MSAQAQTDKGKLAAVATVVALATAGATAQMGVTSPKVTSPKTSNSASAPLPDAPAAQ
jgi:hypothetical protein